MTRHASSSIQSIPSGTTAASGIKRVSVISTGSVSIHPEHVRASGLPLPVWLFGSRRWTKALPINVYVIEHEEGVVLFDLGQDHASVADPKYFPGGIAGSLYRHLARFEIAPHETVTNGLRELGYSIDDVRNVVISHFHQDHIGALKEMRNRDVWVSPEEWRTLEQPLPELRGVLRDHITSSEVDIRWRHLEFQPLAEGKIGPFEFGHDLFGDRSAIVVPTPGHTPGSVSLLVRSANAPAMLFVGDLTYDVHLLEEGIVPGVGKRKELRRVSAMVRQLQAEIPGLVVLPAHDPGAKQRLQAAVGVEK